MKTNGWIDSTPHPVVITDAEGQVLGQNAAFEGLFALSSSGRPMEPVEDLIIASRFRAAYRAARRQALTDGPPLAARSASEFAAVRADGGEFSANLSFARTGDDPPNLATWIRDLTDDQTVLTQTPGPEALHERAEELAGFGSWEWTPESGRVRWSDNLFRIFGLRPAEITPSLEYVFAHCHPDDKRRLEQARDELARSGKRHELRYRYVWPDATVRHLKSTVLSAEKTDGGSRRVIGTVQDITEHHQAQRELAARFAVSDALCDWEAGAPGAGRLVRDLAEALEFEVGVMWVPREEVLAPWVVWQARTVLRPELESALLEARLGRAVGLAGTAWASAEPARVGDLTDHAVLAVRAIDNQTGMHGSLAVPATYGDEVLAVFTFASERQAVLTDQFMRSLIGIGYEIGHFLARRRGEFAAPVLTPRELEVLQLSATGYARRQIAEEIELSEATVKTHMEHIYRKLGVPDRASAVGEALRQGLIH